MPTGYTAFIEDGKITTAKDFIMLCARAFGALIEMRDEPLSAPIQQKIEPDDYYEKRVAYYRSELDKYKSMTAEEIHVENEANYQKEIEDRRQYRDRQARIYALYAPILEDIKAWVPPTPEHENLKKFAIEQIEICLPDLSFRHERPIERHSDEEWIMNRISWCIDQIRFYEKAAKEEKERCDARNKWLEELRDSLLDKKEENHNGTC